jgi:hypothetical protein
MATLVVDFYEQVVLKHSILKAPNSAFRSMARGDGRRADPVDLATSKPS